MSAPKTVHKHASKKAATVKLGGKPQAIKSDEDHGKLCECVDCVQCNFKKSQEVSVPVTHCTKTVKIQVDIACEAVRQVTDTWSYTLKGEKVEDIDPEPIPCPDDPIPCPDEPVQ